MNKNDITNSGLLSANINLSRTSCKQLLALLTEEQTLLAQRSFPALERLIQQKTLLLKRLEDCAKERNIWVEQYQLQTQERSNDTHKAFAYWAKKMGLNDSWQELQALLSECQRANEVNGKIMIRSHATHKQLLDILRGQSGATNLYNDKGAKRSGVAGNALGEA